MTPPTTCAAKPAHPVTTFGVTRMMGLETAANLLGGQQALADAIGINVRSVRAKLNAERGVSNGDLSLAASALDDRAARLTAHAAKLRAEMVPSLPPSTTGETA